MLRLLLGAFRTARSDFERGTNALRAGRMDEALVALQRAVERKPDYPDAHYNLGAVWRSLGKEEAALAAYRRAAELAPGFAQVHADIGSVLRQLRELEEAERSLRRALELQPDHPDALVELAAVYKGRGDWRASIAHLQRAIEVAPHSGRARWAHAVSQIPLLEDSATDLVERRAAFARELAALETWCRTNPVQDVANVVADQQPFYLAYHEISNLGLLTHYGGLSAALMGGWQRAVGLAPPAPRARQGRIRLGIASAHIMNHSVWSALVRGWVERIDPERFELHLFHLGSGRDEQTDRAASLAAAFHGGMRPLLEWAKLIHGSGLDALLYPEIGMDPTTARLAAPRLAPVQATSWGHPETSGLPTIDYYLSAAALEAPGAQANYTEKVELLPGTGSWLPHEAGTAGPVPAAVTEAELRLLCPGTPFKYAARYDALIVEIARRLPRARFFFFRGPPEVLSARLEARMRAAFSSAGVEFERHVVFLPWQSASSFRGVLAASDLYLDTVGFSGFNTALQALCFDLPVVAREGRFLRGRLASGMLQYIGLDELVAGSDEGYVELAVALASDAPRRQALRERIRTAREKLFEDDAPVRALEAFLERAVAAAAGRG